MRSPSAIQLLAVWERGAGQSSVQQGLDLLSLAYPDQDPNELAQLNIGRRDACLLSLRERLFGRSMIALARCSNCTERIEMTFDVADVCVDPSQAAEETLSVDVDRQTIAFRLPNSLDLSAAAESDDVDAARRKLLELCLLPDDAQPQRIEQLPDVAIEAVVEKMAAADPQANLSITVTCPCCDHRWQSTFDIVSFLYQEISVWARRVLREVHVLASAYHWSERDILAMSPWRRNYYLQAVGQ